MFDLEQFCVRNDDDPCCGRFQVNTMSTLAEGTGSTRYWNAELHSRSDMLITSRSFSIIPRCELRPCNGGHYASQINSASDEQSDQGPRSGVAPLNRPLLGTLLAHQP